MRGVELDVVEGGGLEVGRCVGEVAGKLVEFGDGGRVWAGGSDVELIAVGLLLGF